jgi:hypothetical protein
VSFGTSGPDRVLQDFLGPQDPVEFLAEDEANLLAHRVRLVFVADVIPPELGRVVEFLNEQMDPQKCWPLR